MCTCALCLARPHPTGRTRCSTHCKRFSGQKPGHSRAGMGMLRGALVTMSLRFTETLSVFSNSLLFKYFSGKAAVRLQET